MEKHLNVPANTEELAELKSGDYVYLTGTIYTARDAAHKRMYETLLDGKELPVDVKGQFIYYLGPTPARKRSNYFRSFTGLYWSFDRRSGNKRNTGTISYDDIKSRISIVASSG